MEKGEVQVLENIGKEMVSSGIISSDQLAVALETKRNLGGDLGQILLKKKFVTEEEILDFLKKRFNIEFISLKDYSVDPEITKLVPTSLAHKYHFIPLFRTDDTLTIALSDPLDVFAVEDIRTALKYRIEPVFASPAEIQALAGKNFRSLESMPNPEAEMEVVQYGTESEEEIEERVREMASGSKVISEVNKIIQSALKERSSDIHIEPMAESLRVRDRIDGVLEERLTLSKAMHLPIISRIKVMAGMDIAERRIPQDGRVRLKTLGRKVDLRISTYPTMHGEKVVLRLLSQEQVLGLDQLGFGNLERKQFEDLITRPYGIFLVTGPTGSGKTTTLYAALQRINSQDRNIISIEDPIENEISGVNQAQVNTKAGMTFASALRSILRQDPDVIMLGEVRDKETADIAVRAAITGHLVFSTLHTNTAIGAVTRLGDLGIEPFLLSSALIGVLAQRLVRKICPHCIKPADVSDEKKKKFGIDVQMKLSRGAGCKHCRMSGYSGRQALFELVSITPELKQLMSEGASEEKMLELAKKDGTKTLREHGVELMREGKTTLEEVLRVNEES